MIVYIKCSVKNLKPVTFFLDMVELSGGSGAEITADLLKCLSRHGLTHNYLLDAFIGFCSDGASVLLRRKSGVLVRRDLKQLYPIIIYVGIV